MKVTVLVCTRNRPEMIENCIVSILNNTYRDFEFLIVDQSSNKRTEEIVKRCISTDKRVKYLHMDGQGKSRALNLGIRSSSGEIIVTTDDDCVVNKDWIESILEAFDKNPDVALLFGRVIIDKFILMKDKKCSSRLSLLVAGVDGANRSFRRSILKKLKGFDELLGPGAPLAGQEDQDFAYRALRLNLKVLKTGRVIVRHYPVSRTSEQAIISGIRRLEIGKGALGSKYIRCFDLAMFAIVPIDIIHRMFQITQEIIHGEWLILRDKPPILRLLHAWAFSVYWCLLGVRMSIQHNLDKEKCLFIPKKRVF